MRTRKQIEQDGTRKDILALEILLDIRDLLKKKKPPKGKNKVKEIKHGHSNMGQTLNC